MSISGEFQFSDYSYVALFDGATKKEKAILESFLYYHECKIYGQYKRLYPSLKKIAESSTCTVRTVSNFLKKNKDLFFQSIYRVRRSMKKKWKSNTYVLNENFFNVLLKLKKAGFLKNWKKHRSQAFDMFDTEDEITAEFHSKNDFTKKKISIRDAPKFPPITDPDRDLSTREELISKGLNEEEAKSAKVLQEEGLKMRDAIFLAKKFSFDVVFKARNYAHYVKKTSEIFNPLGWFRKQCYFHLKN